MFDGVSFCYDTRTGPPHPIVGRIETGTYNRRGTQLTDAATETGIPVRDLELAVVRGADRQTILGLTGVPANQVIDLANLTWDPRTNDLAMAYKAEA